MSPVERTSGQVGAAVLVPTKGNRLSAFDRLMKGTAGHDAQPKGTKRKVILAKAAKTIQRALSAGRENLVDLTSPPAAKQARPGAAKETSPEAAKRAPAAPPAAGRAPEAAEGAAPATARAPAPAPNPTPTPNPNPNPAPAPAVTPPPADAGLAVGALVDVAPRSWAGMNRPGGTARVTAVHADSVDVKYVLGATTDSRVPLRFVTKSAIAVDGDERTSLRDRSALRKRQAAAASEAAEAASGARGQAVKKAPIFGRPKAIKAGMSLKKKVRGEGKRPVMSLKKSGLGGPAPGKKDVFFMNKEERQAERNALAIARYRENRALSKETTKSFFRNKTANPFFHKRTCAEKAPDSDLCDLSAPPPEEKTWTLLNFPTDAARPPAGPAGPAPAPFGAPRRRPSAAAPRAAADEQRDLSALLSPPLSPVVDAEAAALELLAEEQARVPKPLPFEAHALAEAVLRAGSGAAVDLSAEGGPEAAPHALWTERHAPRRAADVCGNAGVASELAEWLAQWQGRRNEGERPSGRKRKGAPWAEEASSEEDYLSSGSESEAEPSSGRNVLMLVGPPGGGKTAMVFACLAELGMGVIEVNAGMDRSGAAMRKWLLEATQSFRLSAAEAAVTAILVEEADVAFEGVDTGFLPALKDLARATKAPIVLTANRERRDILDALRPVVKRVPRPSAPHLAAALRRVAALEGRGLTPEAALSVSKIFDGDIRRATLFLQAALSAPRGPSGARPPPLELCSLSAASDFLHAALPPAPADRAPEPAPAPEVHGVEQSGGAVAGGAVVRIRGRGFARARAGAGGAAAFCGVAVRFGAARSASVRVLGDALIEAEAPRLADANPRLWGELRRVGGASAAMARFGGVVALEVVVGGAPAAAAGVGAPVFTYDLPKDVQAPKKYLGAARRRRKKGAAPAPASAPAAAAAAEEEEDEEAPMAVQRASPAKRGRKLRRVIDDDDSDFEDDAANPPPPPPPEEEAGLTEAEAGPGSDAEGAAPPADADVPAPSGADDIGRAVAQRELGEGLLAGTVVGFRVAAASELLRGDDADFADESGAEDAPVGAWTVRFRDGLEDDFGADDLHAMLQRHAKEEKAAALKYPEAPPPPPRVCAQYDASLSPAAPPAAPAGALEQGARALEGLARLVETISACDAIANAAPQTAGMGAAYVGLRATLARRPGALRGLEGLDDAEDGGCFDWPARRDLAALPSLLQASAWQECRRRRNGAAEAPFRGLRGSLAPLALREGAARGAAVLEGALEAREALRVGARPPVCGLSAAAAVDLLPGLRGLAKVSAMDEARQAASGRKRRSRALPYLIKRSIVQDEAQIAALGGVFDG